MPPYRKAGTLAAGTALLAPLLFASPASASGTQPDFSVTPLTFTVDAGGHSCTVDADLYRPAGTDAKNPAPAVLTTNGFGGSKSDGATNAIAKAFAARGYVALAYSGLGFGRSGCPISLNDPAVDGKAASQLIDFLAGDRAARDGTTIDYVTKDGSDDPRVGMIGASYGGSIQMATAAHDHRVDALVPFITWNDLSYSLAPNAARQDGHGQGVSSDTVGAFKYQWAGGFFLMGEAGGLLNPSFDLSRIGGAGCLHFAAKPCQTMRLLTSNRYPAAETKTAVNYARSVSPASYMSGVKAPTLFVQGQADSLFNLNEASANYEMLRKQGTPTKMIWQSWGHSGGISNPASGELNIGKGNLETSYVGRRILSWFDRYLQNRPGTDTGPAFAYYRDWAKPSSTYGTSSAFPVGAAQKLYLSGDGALVGSRSAVKSGSREYRNRPFLSTSHSESPLTRAIGLPDRAPHDAAGTHLAWTSRPLSGPAEVVGAPEATLKVTSPATEKVQNSGNSADKLVLFAKIYDVAPDGTRTLVQRLVAPARIPDVTKPFTVKLPGIAHRYEKGHRLSFVIAASDNAYYGNRGVKPVTVTSTPNDTGVLSIPVVSGSVR
ncbi:CocE/NonD family hydrolase [Streptomyces sp. NPDC002795]|uniref:CocE/NonD family hydrolase n=1 Tax=Streptomyces sp. NPDC002795 TaxID=3364665 RepID=UPI00367CBEC7